MEIELGEFYRTKNGKIHKWSKGRTYIEKDEVVKHSKNIMDLIEVGDYVNGSEVLDKYIPRDTWEPIELRIDSKYVNFIIADDIKTILTKEVYERNCYKVEE